MKNSQSFGWKCLNIESHSAIVRTNLRNVHFETEIMRIHQTSDIKLLSLSNTFDCTISVYFYDVITIIFRFLIKNHSNCLEHFM